MSVPHSEDKIIGLMLACDCALSGGASTGIVNWRFAAVRLAFVQQSWFNGAAYAAWENIFYNFNKVSEQDAAAIHRVAS